MTSGDVDPAVPLDGKVALVTGGSRGIGRAISLRLAADGATVAVHYGHDEDAARDTVAAVERAGGAAFAVRADLARDDAIDTLFAHLDAVEQLDVVVNNAAIIGSGPIEDLTPHRSTGCSPST